MTDQILSFPKLIDSSISSGIITFNSNDNPKDKIINMKLELLEENNTISKLNYEVDYFSLVNLNYKLKSALNSIDDSIKNYANK